RSRSSSRHPFIEGIWEAERLGHGGAESSGPGYLAIGRCLLELFEPGVILGDARGEAGRALFKKAGNAFRGIRAATTGEDGAAVPAVSAHRVWGTKHAPQHVAGERDRDGGAVCGHFMGFCDRSVDEFAGRVD